MSTLREELYGNYTTKKFTDIYATAADFITGVSGSGIPLLISNDSLTTLYYLLYSKYGNSHIANSDENQFKYKVYSTIFQYAPTWERNLEIQASLRALTEDEIITGTRQIQDHSYNPSTIPTGPNQPTGEIETVDSQNRLKYTKSKLEGYGILTSLLANDVTEELLGKFKKLFITIVEPQEPLWYITNEGE